MVLLAFSLFFYAWGEPFWILQLILSSALVYTFARLMDGEMKQRKAKSAKLYLIFGLVSALFPLFIFKYLDFFIANLNAILGASIPLAKFTMPIGISFYTFQIITYIVDLYWGNCQVQTRFDYFLLYVSFFPQLIAGPIVRYTDIEARLLERKHSAKDFANGVSRFVAGLAKKCLVANFAGSIVRQTLASGRLAQLSGLEAFLGMLAYTIQIYYDFSAYSDMAIGLGHVFGFDFPENFNYPYVSASVTEFWRRWHISLSSFFRDYLYIPLGGNRRRQYFNLAVVWFLTGFWHGASWNFILWGLFFLVFILLEKLFLLEKLQRLPAIVGRLYMLPIIFFSWTLFYFTDFAELGTFFTRLFAINGQFMSLEGKLLFRQNLLFFIFAFIGSQPIWPKIKSRIKGKYSELQLHASEFYFALNALQIVVLLFLSTASLVGASYNPFLYFRF